jgi:hypothetical protein
VASLRFEPERSSVLGHKLCASQWSSGSSGRGDTAWLCGLRFDTRPAPIFFLQFFHSLNEIHSFNQVLISVSTLARRSLHCK